jgi:UDP-2,3-diacylglucosamine pyrophosphatase LpxH
MAEYAYVIGDTHLGAGQGDPLEDFYQDDAFVAFVKKISRTDTTLYLNGDFVDFAQIGPFDVPKPSRLLWDENASLLKINATLKAHEACFGVLRDFVKTGGRLQIIVGNHDFDFAWPRVQTNVREALKKPPESHLGFTIGADTFAGVHIEHGYQFTPENCPRMATELFQKFEGKWYLERVWGTDFMLQFYNQFEREDHPYADKVKPMLSALWYGIKNGWVSGREVVRLLLFLKKRGLPWSGITSALLVGRDALEPQRVVASFAESEWREVVLDLVRRDATADEFKQAVDELESAERNLVAAPEQVKLEITPALDEPTRPNTLGLFRDDRENRAALDRLKHDGITAVVFGHTHTLVDGNILKGELAGQLFNPGTWLPCLNLASASVKQKIKTHGLTTEMLKDKTLYRTDRWAVRIFSNAGYVAKVQLVACDDI